MPDSVSTKIDDFKGLQVLVCTPLIPIHLQSGNLLCTIFTTLTGGRYVIICHAVTRMKTNPGYSPKLEHSLTSGHVH